jgi:hypothetical protein
VPVLIVTGAEPCWSWLLVSLLLVVVMLLLEAAGPMLAVC